MHLPTPPPIPEWQKPRMFYGKPLTFNPNTHRYTWDGKHVPSVTTILKRLNKPALIQWAADCAVEHIANAILSDRWFSMGPEPEWGKTLDDARKAHTVIRDTAGDVGTQVHEAARAVMSGSPLPAGLPDQALNAVDAFDQWRNEHRIQPIDLERKVFSAVNMYAGTCDFYGMIDDELCVLDFKTGGSDIYDETWFQLAAYERAIAEELSTGPLTYWAVHLGKNTGECKAYRRTPNETNSASLAWSALVALDKAIRAMPKPTPANRPGMQGNSHA